MVQPADGAPLPHGAYWHTFAHGLESPLFLAGAETYMEDPLRMVTHFIMSTPEYQINSTVQ